MSESAGRPPDSHHRREDADAREPAEADAPIDLARLSRLRAKPGHVADATVVRPFAEPRQRTADNLAADAPRTGKARFWRLAIVGLAVVACGGAALAHYISVGRFIYSTDDAYVRTDLAIVSPKISGYVEKVEVVDNQHVKVGQVLARIDAGDYVLAVKAARQKVATQDATIARIRAQAEAQDAAVAQAAAQVQAARAERARAQSELDRVRSLAASDFASKQRYDQVLADRDKADAAFAGAEARLAGAKADLVVLKSQSEEAKRMREELATAQARAERDLSFAGVRAPFGGTIGNRVVEPGQFVQPGARLLAIAPDNHYYVEANFKETQLDRLAPGQKAKVYIDAYDGKAVAGVVESIAPASGSEFSLLPPENATGNFTKITQRFPVRIRLAHLDSDRLRAGMSVVVDVDTRSGGAGAAK
ncbi:HlyD family secretion protein [Rhodoblastus acidophilus]|uniref:HlyD family secretion protein n=1 Tax=Candidatus Rhodoblastus alkanivorans TaxID=2954117 RepID=A0ABS9ZBF5_9HYPH|nr:HlyD family secretion protein [Candidatus Rhodoblastus alkanivorans]MCI4677841.1 HlyD family secretion protein [Candidatus Rhodoblastus alkanivorans]MCI4684660.1 HlyD family secretion protein [Candidatus Rhodoblastus alkanivorans]MDI4641982.1 HlyD family secretion protein [Rhodoblastus acidophilus]